MPASALTVQAASLAGLTPSYAAADAAGNYFSNSGKEYLQVKNTGASTVVTINSQVLCNQGSDHDITVTVGATIGDKIIGPFPKDRFNDPSGFVQIAYSQVTGITVAAITVAAP